MKKELLYKIAGGSALVVVPTTATLGVVLGTKEEKIRNDKTPASSVGDYYFDENMSQDSTSSLAAQKFITPSKGHNLSQLVRFDNNMNTAHAREFIARDANGNETKAIKTVEVNLSKIKKQGDIDRAFQKANEDLYQVISKMKPEEVASTGIYIGQDLIKRVAYASLYKIKGLSDTEEALANEYFHYLGNVPKDFSGINPKSVNIKNNPKAFFEFFASQNTLVNPHDSYFYFEGGDRSAANAAKFQHRGIANSDLKANGIDFEYYDAGKNNKHDTNVELSKLGLVPTYEPIVDWENHQFKLIKRIWKLDETSQMRFTLGDRTYNARGVMTKIDTFDLSNFGTNANIKTKDNRNILRKFITIIVPRYMKEHLVKPGLEMLGTTISSLKSTLDEFIEMGTLVSNPKFVTKTDGSSVVTDELLDKILDKMSTDTSVNGEKFIKTINEFESHWSKWTSIDELSNMSVSNEGQFDLYQLTSGLRVFAGEIKEAIIKEHPEATITDSKFIADLLKMLKNDGLISQEKTIIDIVGNYKGVITEAIANVQKGAKISDATLEKAMQVIPVSGAAASAVKVAVKALLSNPDVAPLILNVIKTATMKVNKVDDMKVTIDPVAANNTVDLKINDYGQLVDFIIANSGELTKVVIPFLSTIKMTDAQVDQLVGMLKDVHQPITELAAEVLTNGLMPMLKEVADYMKPVDLSSFVTEIKAVVPAGGKTFTQITNPEPVVTMFKNGQWHEQAFGQIAQKIMGVVYHLDDKGNFNPNHVSKSDWDKAIDYTLVPFLTTQLQESENNKPGSAAILWRDLMKDSNFNAVAPVVVAKTATTPVPRLISDYHQIATASPELTRIISNFVTSKLGFIPDGYKTQLSQFVEGLISEQGAQGTAPEILAAIVAGKPWDIIENLINVPGIKQVFDTLGGVSGVEAIVSLAAPDYGSIFDAIMNLPKLFENPGGLAALTDTEVENVIKTIGVITGKKDAELTKFTSIIKKFLTTGFATKAEFGDALDALIPSLATTVIPEINISAGKQLHLPWANAKDLIVAAMFDVDATATTINTKLIGLDSSFGGDATLKFIKSILTPMSEIVKQGLFKVDKSVVTELMSAANLDNILTGGTAVLMLAPKYLQILAFNADPTIFEKNYYALFGTPEAATTVANDIYELIHSPLDHITDSEIKTVLNIKEFIRYLKGDMTIDKSTGATVDATDLTPTPEQIDIIKKVFTTNLDDLTKADYDNLISFVKTLMPSKATDIDKYASIIKTVLYGKA